MAAIHIDEAPAPAPARERRLEAARYPDRGNTVMPTVAHEVARLVARDVRATRLEPSAFVAVELTLYLRYGDPKRFLIPDVLVALGRGQADPVQGGRRHVYRIWDEGGPPDLVIELASKRTVKRDNVGKKEDYAACGVQEYVQFDPLGPADPEGPLLVPRLWVWQLAGGPLLTGGAGGRWRLPERGAARAGVGAGRGSAAATGGCQRHAAAYRYRAAGHRLAARRGAGGAGGSSRRCRSDTR